MCTWALSLSVGLLSFFGEALPSPAPTISFEYAARLYRIEVYNQFRHDRAEYDRRIAQAEQLRTAVQNSAQPEADREAALRWFVAARKATVAQPAHHLPALPRLALEHPVVTSGREHDVILEPVPSDVATTLEIQLPAEAVPTTPASVTPRPTTTFTNLRTVDPEIEGTTAPVIIELPADKRAIDTSKPMPVEKPMTSAPKATSGQTPETAAPVAIEAEDPHAIEALFEPVTTPAPATEAATDADPFAP